MKTTTIVLLAVGAYALYYVVEGAQGASSVQIVFKGINIKSPTNYVITVTVQNVANVGAQINSLTGNLLLNGNQLANFSAFPTPPVQIPANGQVDVNITVQPSLLSLPGDVMSLLSGASNAGDLNFTITGNVNVSGLVVPFTNNTAVSV